MSGLGAWIWGTSQIDDAIDKATSELLPSGSEDIALNLEICDQIRSKSAPAKDAMRALKRRLNHKNPNVQLLALSLTDVCIKNGGDLFLVEVMSREFLDNLVSILKIPGLNHDVKSTILRFIQNWSIALDGRPHLGYIGQVYKTLLSEGYKFPPKDLTAANSAMVDTQTAPEWIDSDVCLHCRTAFTFTNRKHHCRNCGKVYDQACSSKSMKLPHFGITQDVRVCDDCYKKLTKKAEKADKPHKHVSSHRPSANELADAELQRAIQLSLQEVNNRRPGYTPSQPSPSRWGYSEPPLIDRTSFPSSRRIVKEEDPELKAAIEASLKEANAPKPSAPIVSTPTTEKPAQKYNSSQASVPVPSHPPLPKIPTYELQPLETDTIMTFNQTVEQVQAQGGRDLSRYPAVTELYEKANGLRPKLALSLDDAGRKEQMLSDMHDKLSQAVKLYDQILSEQVAHPRWRSTSTAYNFAYQPQQAYTAMSPNGYAQWGAQASPSPMQYQVPSEPASGSQVSHMASPLQATHPDSQPQPHQQQVIQAQPEQQQHMIATNALVSVPAPIQSPTYSPPTNSMSHTIQGNQAMQLLPAIPQSPPPASQYPIRAPPAPSFQHNPSPSLTRHNTVNYHALPSGPAPPSPHLARSNTVAYSISQRPLHHVHPQQQQSVQHVAVSSLPPVPTNLPQFPSVPTSAPQPSYSMYGSSVPPPFKQNEERKEALLIDL